MLSSADKLTTLDQRASVFGQLASSTEAKVWRPFARQEEFLCLPDSIFEALYGGAAGGGKSECLLLFPIARGFYQHPKFKGIIFRRTYPELEKEIILRSLDWYPATGARYNDEKKRWTFPSGAIMQFGHSEYEQDVRKYDTTEYNYMAFDELTSFTEFQYTYLTLSRCRSSSSLPAIVRSGTNPGNVGHGWVRKKFIESGPYGSILVDPVTKTKRIFIQSLCTDNPHIDPGYINRLAGLPEAERRAKRDGDWYFFAGQVFEDWRECRLESEPENAQHVLIEPFKIPLYWPRLLAIDWGYQAMTIALWAAISPDLRLYVYREYSGKKLKISTWATDIGRLTLEANETLADAVICRSAYQTRGDEFTIADQFEQHSKLKIRAADNDRTSGLLLMREYIRWKPKPSSQVLPSEEYNEDRAIHILRTFGTPAYNQYLEQFSESSPETNLPRLQVFPNCREFIKCVPLCVYDDKRLDDVAEFDGDDPYDCGRYLIKAADDYMQPNEKHNFEQKKSFILKDLDEHQDQTRFYREMERLERESIHSVKPFRIARRR